MNKPKLDSWHKIEHPDYQIDYQILHKEMRRIFTYSSSSTREASGNNWNPSKNNLSTSKQAYDIQEAILVIECGFG